MLVFTWIVSYTGCIVSLTFLLVYVVQRNHRYTLVL